MATDTLPSKDSRDLHLVVGTREEHLASQHVNSDEWRGPLSLEAYLRREEMLFDQELTRNGKATPWMLVHQPDPLGPRQVVCSCESLNKTAVVAMNGQVEDTIAHGIASVFCPPQYRGRGYAGRMMTEVAQRLREWQADQDHKVLFSVLYSDIGKRFYATRGWHPFPSTHVSLPAALTPTPAGIRLLRDADLPDLCARDEQLLRRRIARSANASRPAVAMVPDYHIIRWHHAREDFVSQELNGKIPEIKGACIGDTPGTRVWAYWTRVWSNPKEEAPNTLHLLRLVIEDEAELENTPASAAGVERLQDSNIVRATAAIMAVARDEAARWDMKEVHIWNPSSATLAAAQSIHTTATVVVREEESIASLLWYGPGSWEDVDWVYNEKYGWN